MRRPQALEVLPEESTMTHFNPTPRAPRPGRPRRAGFTLVELLVVIGVIALLISILLPSINAAQRSAQRVACSANLRSIGQAYATYTGESKGKYPSPYTGLGPNGPWGLPPAPPPARTSIGTVGRPHGIAIVLTQGYLPDPRILYCPSAERTRDNTTASTGNRNAAGVAKISTDDDAWHPGPGAGGMHQTGYAIWAGWVEEFENRAPSDIRANWFASGLREGADKVLASDHMVRGAPEYEDWNGHLLRSRRIVGTTPFTGYPADPTPNATVNFAGGNVLYNDGHVVWKSTTETVFRLKQLNTEFDVFW
jgi:prepilin-type N-terminal cleavage/methylation domain-containing protein